MRTDITPTELLIQAERARRVSPVRLEVQNGSGTWKELTNLSGTGFANLDFLKSLSWSDGVDPPTWVGTVVLSHALRAASGAMISIAPDVETSPANVDDASAYDPLIDGMRRIRWFTTTHRLDGTGGVERKVFDGYVVSSEQSDNLTLQVADLGHLLVITQIRDERVYGSTAGEPLEDVIQQILDDNMGVGAVTLVVDPAITAAGVMVREFKQDRVKVMEAVRALAIETIGANVRYMWNGAGEMELRLFLPPRTKVTPDFTFNADNYKPKPIFRRNTEDIRNTGRLYYQNTDTESVLFVEYHVLESIERYYARYFEFKEVATKNVNTEPEASGMLTAAIADLAFPKAEKRFTTDYAWPFEVHDLLLMQANGNQYTTDQPQFVTGITHTYGQGQTQTQFDTRGTIAGFHNQWLIREGPGPRPNTDDDLVALVNYYAEGEMYGGQLFNGKTNGCIWLIIQWGITVRKIHVWARNNAPEAVTVQWPPTSSDMYKAVTLERPEGKVPQEGNWVRTTDGKTVWQSVVPIPTDEGTQRTFIIQAEGDNGKLGPQQRFGPVTAASYAAGAGVADLAFRDIARINATTIRYTYTFAGAGGGAVLIMRDRIGIEMVSMFDSGAGPFTYDEENLHADKAYQCAVISFNAGESGPRNLIDIPAWTSAISFGVPSPDYEDVAGEPKVRILLGGTPPGTATVGVEKSRDSGQTDPWVEAVRLPVASFPFYDAVVIIGTFYRLVAYDGAGAKLDTSLPSYWTSPF